MADGFYKWSRDETTLAFFNLGFKSIKDGKMIFDTKENNGMHYILLYYGLEMVFKSLILLKNKDINLNILSDKNQYGHKLEKLFRKSVSSCNFFNDGLFRLEFDILIKLYGKDFTKIRYPNTNSFKSFPMHIYDSLIDIIETKIKPDMLALSKIKSYPYLGDTFEEMGGKPEYKIK